MKKTAGLTTIIAASGCLAGIALVSGALVSGAMAEEAKSPSGNPVGSGWSAAVSADGSTAVSLDANQTKLVQSVSGYFNTMKTLQGRFVQTGADGEVMKGKFMMKRPGMFRFDYSRPSRQVIISDGTYLAIQDHDLNDEDRVALDQTPFRVLLRENVDLMRDAVISEVQENDERVLLAIRDKSPDTPGKIRLVLAKQPELQLKEWITTDAQGLDTRVEVGRVEKDAEIDASKFVIKAPGNPFPQ
ncbi:MAG: outer membrane lipoprotein carrier protein LolA [Alphaproteobacteria bacterium]|nr:outer membrane lipoprotein carrier protein LolA [Alphaproteobacteria bacterium]